MTDKEQWFWEQCGLEYNDDWSDDRPYKDPTGTILHNWKGIDLNNLIKYAIPLLIYFSLTKMETSYKGKHWISEARIKKDGKRYSGHGLADNPEDAAFEAIYQCLGGKEDEI